MFTFFLPMSSKKCGYLEQTTRGLKESLKKKEEIFMDECHVVIKDRPTLVFVGTNTSLLNHDFYFNERDLKRSVS